MAYALVANTHAAGTQDSVTTAAINTTGATLIVVGMADYETATQAVLSDSKSNSWTGLTAQAFVGDQEVRLFYCAAPSVGAGHTFTLTGTTDFPAIAVTAWSGAHATPFDQQNGATGDGVNSLQTGSVTPSEANELVITALAINNTFTPSIDGGFAITDTQQYGTAVNYGLSLAYLIQGGAAATNPTWSWSDGTRRASAAIATFKAATTTDTVTWAAMQTQARFVRRWSM